MSTMTLNEDMLSLAEFEQNPAEFIKQLTETGRPLILTVDGEAKLVVQDVEAYQQLLESVERQELIKGIQESLESMRQGKGIPLDEFKKKMSDKYGLPLERPKE